METAFAIKNGSEPQRRSIQYLIDCDHTNFGCGGGWMLDAYEFTKKNGLILEDDYKTKYQGKKEACKDKDLKDKPKI